MSDDWVHPPGWDPESKAKAAEERKNRTFFQKNRYCLIPTVLGVIAGLPVAFLFTEKNYQDYRGADEITPVTAGLELFGMGLALSLTMMIVIRLLDQNSNTQSNAQDEKERKAAKRWRKLMWAFVPMILAILYFVLMIPVTFLTGEPIAVASAAGFIFLAALVIVPFLAFLFISSLFDAAEKRSRRPPTD